jgi:hypothetical protein
MVMWTFDVGRLMIFSKSRLWNIRLPAPTFNEVKVLEITIFIRPVEIILFKLLMDEVI